ncbi:MAG: superoxide dismutase [Candidatus Pacebacteria bacterium]|nr:superoxide dismutase [Candidatus Paceibacterota bacterium]
MAKAPFSPKTFSIPEVSGISANTMATHMKLYEGYVKHANLILEKIEDYSKNSETNAYALGELQRRFAFEFDGMRNHEYYFALLEDGPRALPADSALAQAIEAEWGSVEAFRARFRSIALTRGIGWAILYYDKASNRLLTQWVDEQHLGHLTGLSVILPLDVWEHAFLLDYAPAEKAKYVDAFLSAINWERANEWFEQARS